MKLKTFRAPSMAEALSAVKKDLGREAVILHTRSVKVGGVLGFRKKTIIEITAADEPAPARRQPAPRPRSEPIAAAAISAYNRTARATERPTRFTAPAPIVLPGQPEPGTFASVAPAATPRPTTQPQTPAPAAPPPTPEPILMSVRERRAADQRLPRPGPMPPASIPVTDSGTPDLYRELADIKLLVNQVLHSSPSTSGGVAAGAMPEALFKHYLRLLESSVSRDIADAVIGAVRDELTPGELDRDDIVRTTVLRHIADLIPCHDIAVPPAGQDGSPHVIALVGPTGVGKTTTIAKLAAAYKLRHGKSVALITSDTYRIAAVDQLRTYAGIIGLPLKVVLTPGEMAQAVESLRGYDTILIDTAGRSQFNADRIAELRQFIDAASPSEIHLVLSSAASEPVLTRTAESFASLRPNRVILTKLDEAVNFGVIVNVSRRLQTALSFVTTGQEVPDDIEQGQPDRLARMVLDNSLGAPGVQSRQRRADVGVMAAEREAVFAGAGGGGGRGGGGGGVAVGGGR